MTRLPPDKVNMNYFFKVTHPFLVHRSCCRLNMTAIGLFFSILLNIGWVLTQEDEAMSARSIVIKVLRDFNKTRRLRFCLSNTLLKKRSNESS